MIDPTTIQITVRTPAGVSTDITTYVIFETATFEAQANAVPGSFSMTLKDSARDLSFTTGSDVRLYLDGDLMFGGILLQATRQYAFPVVDTSDISEVSARQWNLSGLDYNIWFDKRVFRDLDHPTDSLMIIDGVHSDREIIKNYHPTYIDIPPGVNLDDEVDTVSTDFGDQDSATGNKKKAGYALPAQGSMWREDLNHLAARSAAVFYIDANKKLNFHALEDQRASWALVDRHPNGNTTVGVRDVSATEDGAPIVTEALVWAGLEQLASAEESDPSGTFFAYYPHHPGRDDAERQAVTNQSVYGLWQYAEVNFQRGDDQKSTNHRAEAIVSGPPGSASIGQGGLRYPVWSINATWFAHEVPTHSGVKQHLHPGNVVDLIFYVLGTDVHHPLIQVLPLRSVAITFPQIPSPDGGPDALTYVKFTGQFGLSYSDPRALWKFLLLERNKKSVKFYAAGGKTSGGAVTSASTAAGFGGWWSGPPTETPSGLNSTFTIPFPYIQGTLAVYINGLKQRLNVEYRESDPELGQFIFYTSPLFGDELYIEARTALSLNNDD